MTEDYFVNILFFAETDRLVGRIENGKYEDFVKDKRSVYIC